MRLFAKVFDYPVDGYSIPYQYLTSFGSTFYTFLGLFLLRKIVLHFFSDLISAIVFIIIVFGTNYFLMQFISVSSTHNFEFTFLSLLIWLTIKFHEAPSIKNGIILGICLGIIGCIRPPGLIFSLIPLGWNLNLYNGIKGKIRFFWKNHKREIILLAFSTIIIFFIQFSYWKITSGHFLINSYDNAGENFDWLTPYTFDFLFSFRKGWLLYTPIMLFSIIGLFNWRKKNLSQGNLMLLTFFIFLYVVSCWTNWWYAASYSQRPMVDIYPLLAIGLGYFILEIKKNSHKILLSGIAFLLLGLNLFQSYQLTRGILHTSLMTKDYYFSTFGQIVTPSSTQQKLLLIDREKGNNEGFKNKHEYKKCYAKKIKFSENFELNDTIIYTPIIDISPLTISKKEHFWITMSWKYEGEYNNLNGKIMNIAAMHNSKGYNWNGKSITDSLTRIDTINKTISFDYLSPYFRNKKDVLRISIWKQSGLPIKIKSVLIKGFEKKD